jgi:hypothetical protein
MRDENLLRRVSLKTDGTNIHDVNGIIGAYNASCEYVSRLNLKSDPFLFYTVAVLSEFADTGDIKLAKKNWDKYLPRLRIKPEHSEGE